MTNDYTKNNQIKDEQRVFLRNMDSIMGRWKGNFDKLLNEENHRSVFEDGVPNDGLPYQSVVSCARLTTSPCHLFRSSAALFSW